MDSESKINSSKKLIRQEKKKKKMLAYLEVAKLNDLDRAKILMLKPTDDDGIDDEPACKRVKSDVLVDSTTTTCGTVVDGLNTSGAVATAGPTETPRQSLSGEEYLKLKQELRLRKDLLKNMPRFLLKSVGDSASVTVPLEDRVPLFLSDIQHLLLYSTLGSHAPYTPQRWCYLEKYTKISQTIVLVVENLSLYHYTRNEHLFPNLTEIFENKVEVVTPSVYRGDLVEEIAAVPLTSTQKDKLVKEFGSLDNALQSSKVFSMLKAVFPVQQRIKHVQEKTMHLPEGDKFPRTHLLLSAWQLVEENYPLPLKGNLQYKYANYVMTKDVFEEVTPHSPMFGIDCEMCKTTTGELELTRISIVNENHEILYEKFVRPDNKIVDYLTRYSGITPKILKDVKTRLKDVQDDLRELLPADAILVGQSLNSDLHALKMMHPYIIDTSIIFNVTGDRNRKTKLQILAREFLDVKIQESHTGHCSIEDSLSSLKLVQLKLANSIEFGDAVLSGHKGCIRNFRNFGDNYFGSSLLHHITKIDKTVAVIGQEDTIRRYKNYIHENEATNRISCITKDTNKSIIKFIGQKSNEFNLSLAHLRLLEDDLSDARNQETCENIDKFLRRTWTHLHLNGMFIVLFGGENGGNGASFIQIKKNSRTV